MAISSDICKRLLFVGNSHTYQPKELGGVPGVVARLAKAATGQEFLCESVVKGGADLLELWLEFEAEIERRPDLSWDVVILQVGGLDRQETLFATMQVLEHRYAPLLLRVHPSCKVVLYQTWSGPKPHAEEASLLVQGAQTCCEMLVAAGLSDVRVAHAAHAFSAIRNCSNGKQLYPALWKDDMGHGSALAGALVGTLILQTLDLVSAPRRPLAMIIEAILPNAWRTASPGFADDVSDGDIGQKGWREASKGGAAELLNLAAIEDDHPLNKYPPGLRTERRSLGVSFGDDLEAAVVQVLAKHVVGVEKFKDTTAEKSNGIERTPSELECPTEARMGIGDTVSASSAPSNARRGRWRK